jgi:hypothetical protein
MDITIITTADGRVIETTTGYFAIKTRKRTDAEIEYDKADGTKGTIAAAAIIGYEQRKARGGTFGFARALEAAA